jgi:cytochrome b561
MDTPKRYHPALVTLHWLVVILVSLNLYLGLFVFTNRSLGFRVSNQYTPLHMAAGIAILALVIVRFFVRMGAKRPEEARSGSKLLDVLAKAVHYGLYVMLIATTVIGLTFALQTNRFQRTFLGAQSGFERPGGGFPGGAPGQPSQPPSGFPGVAPGQGFQGGFQGGRPPGGFFGLLGVHLWAAYVLAGLVVLHVLAALYHQFIRRDGLIGRMWYGTR